MSAGILSLKDGNIFFEDAGIGLPVVLIHAGYLDSRMWDDQMDALAEGYRVIRYDVRGFGKSSKPRGEYSDASDLKALLDHLGIDKAVLVGASNGGRISLDFAVENLHRVMALVLVDPGVKGYESTEDPAGLWGPLEKLETHYLGLREKGKFREAAEIDVDYWTHLLSGDVRERVLDMAAENVNTETDDPDRFQASPEPPAFDRLSSLTMPVKIILGDRDWPGMLEIGEKIHELIPGSSIAIIKDADHIPVLSQPEKFTEIILRFLSSLR